MRRKFSLALATLGALLALDSQPNVHAQQTNKDPVQIDTPPPPPPPPPAAVPPGIATDHTQAYRIGVACVDLPPVLRSHLQLGDQEGVVVESVMDSSPASRAGIQRFDVLLSVNGESVSNVQDVSQRIQAAKSAEVELSLIRQGKRQSTKVTPEAVDASEFLGFPPHNVPLVPGQPVLPPNMGGVPPEIRDLLQQWQSGGNFQRFDAPEGWSWRRLMPGVIIDDQADPEMQLPSFPDHFSLNIEKSGDGPAKIKVQRGEDRWELTEDNLEQLPADVRPLVENMLHGSRPTRPTVVPHPNQPTNPARPQLRNPGNDTLNRRLDGLELQLKEIQDAIRSVQEHP